MVSFTDLSNVHFCIYTYLYYEKAVIIELTNIIKSIQSLFSRVYKYLYKEEAGLRRNVTILKQINCVVHAFTLRSRQISRANCRRSTTDAY